MAYTSIFGEIEKMTLEEIFMAGIFIILLILTNDAGLSLIAGVIGFVITQVIHHRFNFKNDK
jgi:hypothetical protein